jgi:hypothetical protein
MLKNPFRKIDESVSFGRHVLSFSYGLGELAMEIALLQLFGSLALAALQQRQECKSGSFPRPQSRIVIA